MEKIKIFLYSLFGRVYVTKDISNCNEDLLLHISDTPSNFYPALKLLLRSIKPKYVVHTGDLVDNIKLELYPYKKDLYKKKVKVLINILENSNAHNIYLVLGNHDDYSTVKEYTERSIVIEKGKTIMIDNDKYNINHYSKEIMKAPEQYNLYGHDLTMPSKEENNRIFLNGIDGINIISLKSKKIFVLSYPYGTNDDRMCKSNIGI